MTPTVSAPRCCARNERGSRSSHSVLEGQQEEEQQEEGEPSNVVFVEGQWEGR